MDLTKYPLPRKRFWEMPAVLVDQRSLKDFSDLNLNARVHVVKLPSYMASLDEPLNVVESKYAALHDEMFKKVARKEKVFSPSYRGERLESSLEDSAFGEGCVALGCLQTSIDDLTDEELLKIVDGLLSMQASSGIFQRSKTTF